MAVGRQVVVGTEAQLLFSNAGMFWVTNPRLLPVGEVAPSVFLGGPDVAPDSGYELSADKTLFVHSNGDELYVVAPTDGQRVDVLEMD